MSNLDVPSLSELSDSYEMQQNEEPRVVQELSEFTRTVSHSRFEHLLHVFDLLSGELLELGVGVEHLGAGLAVLSVPLVQLASPHQFSSQLRVRVGCTRFILRAVLVFVDFHGSGLLGSFFDLQPTAELRRELICGHFQIG